MDKQLLEKFKKKLEKLRSEILAIIEGEEDRTGSMDVSDGIDQATEMIEQQMGSLMSSNFKKNLEKVDYALNRIETGKYGKCLGCGTEIEKKRLEVLPLTEHCIKCQTDLENIEQEFE